MMDENTKRQQFHNELAQVRALKAKQLARYEPYLPFAVDEADKLKYTKAIAEVNELHWKAVDAITRRYGMVELEGVDAS